MGLGERKRQEDSEGIKEKEQIESDGKKEKEMGSGRRR